MSRSSLYQALLIACLALLVLLAPGLVRADDVTPSDLSTSLKSMTSYLAELDEALTRGEVQAARHEYDELHEQWEAIEDGVRAQSPDAYAEIEDYLHALRDALAAQPLAVEKARAAAQALDRELDEVAARLGQTAPAASSAATTGPSLAELNERIETALSRLAAGDRQGAQAELKQFTDGWGAVEDEVRAASRTSYRAIEDAIAEARVAFATEPFDADKARAALRALETQTETYLKDRPRDGAAAESTATGTSLTPLIGYLDQAASEAHEGDAAKAAAAMKEFQTAWPGLETLVAARSAHAYEALEEGMAKAYALLASTPPDTAAALAVITEMQGELAPLTAEVRYGVADAAIIMLREGLEALLIIGALLAFLKKSHNADKQRWIWLGGLGGVLASIVTAVVLQRVFVSATAGANRELIEGVTGLVAASLLVYVSYWLHSKSHLGAWQQYIRQQSNAALVRNSLFSL
ncbi:MAG: FTR1 family protein, partial [Anaerolineae bacterium]|nr:FTR1 family protein [Anaerolineae bacterium]